MRNKKILIPLSVFVALGLLLVVLEKTNVTDYIKLKPNSKNTAQGPTPEQKQQEAEANAAAKKQHVENEASNPPTGSPTTPSSGKVDMSTKQESNGTVTVFTEITGYGDGTCNLTVTNGTRTTTQSANVVYQSEYSSCAGFSVPISSVGTGTWSLTLTVTSNGSSASKTISAQVN